MPEIPIPLKEELKKRCAEVAWKPTTTYPDHMAYAYILRKNGPLLCFEVTFISALRDNLDSEQDC